VARQAVNLDDYRRTAKRKLPKLLFDVVDGGANDEITLRENRGAFNRIALRPRALAPVNVRDLSTTVMGTEVSMPAMLAPCGTARLAHSDAEVGVARAAGRAGTLYALSTVGSYSPEAVAEAATGPLWFQLYPPADRVACEELIARVRKAGKFSAMVVTIDGPVLGHRERDSYNGLEVPLRWTPKVMLEGVRRPRWAYDFVRTGAMAAFGGGTHSPKSVKESGEAIKATANPITAETIAYIRDAWDGPLLVKGVLRGDEVPELLDLGVEGIVVSNHGGRQLDTVPASIEALPEVVAAVGGRAEVYLDGGIRRGTDVIKALALGARGVFIGRPYLFALACGGEAKVEEMLGIMHDEIDSAMALVGCSRIDDVNRSLVRLGDPWATAKADDPSPLTA
jgi:isopentenyl diphosphate isomerase/L-lactate dehydrogenase-like FMN-dependent dehydrogenase